MSVSGYEYSDEMFLFRPTAPNSVNRNSNVRLATPQPRRARMNAVSAPPTPLKSCNSSNTNKSQGRVRKSQSSTPGQNKVRNLSTSPTLLMMDIFKDPTLYDEPIDLAVPSMTNLPPVNADISPSLPPIPLDLVEYDVEFKESLTTNLTPEKEPEMSFNNVDDLPPVPDNVLIMAVENC